MEKPKEATPTQKTQSADRGRLVILDTGDFAILKDRTGEKAKKVIDGNDQ